MDTDDRILDKKCNSIVAVDENGTPLPTIPSKLKRSLKEITTELMALQVCNSPNVVKLYKYKLNHPYKMSDGRTWPMLAMVLEICENGELFDLVYHGEGLSEKVARTFFRQIVNGLEALHEKNISHRDIKPQNILLTSDFQCKIADIGSGARFRDNKLMKTTRVGTKGFQAPELLCGKNYSKKCDTFSLGVTLFVLLSKTMPAREQATVQDPLYVFMAAKKFEDYWAKFARGNIHFSPDLQLLLQGMLAYQPVERMNINDVQLKDGSILSGMKSSAWYNKEIYSQPELKAVLQDKFKAARTKRNQLRNPETEIHSTTFRSGTPTVLPGLPPQRTAWAFKLDPTAKVAGPEGEMIKLHPDHLMHTLMNHFEVQTKRCTSVYNKSEGELELKCQDGDFGFSVMVNGYEQDGDYYLDIQPVSNWHHPGCKQLTDDIEKLLNVA